MKSVEARDQYTEGHSHRVGEIALKIAKELKYNDFKMEQLRIASILHDVGKIGVLDSILHKPTSLTEEEFNIIKQHPQKGHDILNQIKNLDNIKPIVLHHHERYDGKGYPRGIKGENIPIEGRCLGIVDAFDAMITDRPYRKGLSIEAAIQELIRCSGTQFDPKLTEIFIKLYREGEISVA